MAQKNSDKMPKQKHAYLFLVLLLLLFACRDNGGSQPSGAGSPNATSLQTGTGAEITLTLAVLPDSAAAYRALVAAFEADHPGVTVRVVDANRLIGDDPNPARVLAQTADVFPSTYAFNGDWQALTLDLTPFAGAADFDAADFPDGLLTAADGTIRHLPQELDVTLILYNKALFDVAGVDYPAPDWTWEQFATVAAQLTERYGDFTARWGWADGLQAAPLVGAGLRRPLADYSVTPPSPRLADEEVEEAVRRYLALFGTDGAAPTPQSAATAYAEALALIQEGRVAMWPATTGFLSSFSRLDYGALPLPVVDGGTERRLYVRSFGFAASAATGQPQAAWQLIEYLSRQQGAASQLPARASVRRATNAWEESAPQVAEVVEAYLDAGFELPAAATRQGVERAVSAALLLESDVAQALAEQATIAAQALAGDPEPLTAVIAAPDAEDSVTEILFIEGSNINRQRALAQVFEEENSHIRIELQPPQYSFFSNNIFRSSPDRAYGNRQADCFVHEPLSASVEVTKVLTLDALIALDPNVSHDDFFPAALSAFQYNGELIALPEQIKTPIIGYDTILFDAAGIPYPESDWTLQQFLDTAVALTTGEEDDKQYGYVPTIADYGDAWMFLHAFGVDLLDRSTDPPMARFDTPAIAEALRWYVALSETFGVKPRYLTNQFDYTSIVEVPLIHSTRQSLFGARRGAMWLSDGSESLGAFPTPTAEIAERQYAVFPIAIADEAAFPLKATGFYISGEAGPEQRQACWQWITFLTEHDAGLGLPARQTTAHSAEFRQRAGPALEAMLQFGERLNTDTRHYPAWMELQGWYSIAMTRIIQEGQSAEDALATTQTEFENFRACVLAAELFDVDEKLHRVRQCAAAATPLAIYSE